MRSPRWWGGVALVPEMRTPQTRTWVLYLLSHFVAVTSWVLALETLRNVPRGRRTAYYGGLGSTLILLNMCVGDRGLFGRPRPAADGFRRTPADHADLFPDLGSGVRRARGRAMSPWRSAW